MTLPLLKHLTKNELHEKWILLRLDLNVPIKKETAEGDFRIKRSLPTLAFLKEKGARVLIISHHSEETQSLRCVAEYLNTLTPVRFTEDIFNAGEINAGEIVVGENIRFFKEEKENDPHFTDRLASLGDIYVNEAFSASHRAHASIVGLPARLPSYAGLLFEEEVEELSRAFHPPHPFLLIIGGGKVSSKFHLIEKFLPVADTIFVAGLLAVNFFKEKGYEIGDSTYEEVESDVGALLKEEKILLPSDIVVQKGAERISKAPHEVSPGEKILDVGQATIDKVGDVADKARFIIWNGPVGDYLIDGFDEGSISLLHRLAGNSARTIVGGGDTMALVARTGLWEGLDFTSTGGGAMLEFLSARTLPGIRALEESMRAPQKLSEH